MNDNAQELFWELCKDRSRAFRRHEVERVKAARRYGLWGREDLAAHPVQWGKALHSATPCSCVMCGNPRKWFKEPSLQERSASQEAWVAYSEEW